jgi:hypothetical protein
MQPNQPRCLRCGGVRVTPPTRIEAEQRAYLWYKTPGGGFFQQGARLLLEGSACLDCGHVEVFLSGPALQEARSMPSFTPWDW